MKFTTDLDSLVLFARTNLSMIIIAKKKKRKGKEKKKKKRNDDAFP